MHPPGDACTISVKNALLPPKAFGLLIIDRCRREKERDVIKVKANSRTAAVAGAIAGVIREHRRAEVQAIGAGAVNQAIKALVLAKGYLAEDGIPVVCVPEFVDVDIDGKVRTAIKLIIEPRTAET